MHGKTSEFAERRALVSFFIHIKLVFFMVTYFFQYGGLLEEKRQYSSDADAMIVGRECLRIMRRLHDIPYVRIWAQCFNGQWRQVAAYK